MPLAPASRERASGGTVIGVADVWFPVGAPDGPGTGTAGAPEGPGAGPGLGTMCPAGLTSGLFRYGGSYLGMVLFLLNRRPGSNDFE